MCWEGKADCMAERDSQSIDFLSIYGQSYMAITWKEHMQQLLCLSVKLDMDESTKHNSCLDVQGQIQDFMKGGSAHC